MTHEELATIALRYETTMSDAMLRALGVRRAGASRGRSGVRGAISQKYRGAKKLMQQKFGVKL